MKTIGDLFLKLAQSCLFYHKGNVWILWSWQKLVGCFDCDLPGVRGPPLSPLLASSWALPSVKSEKCDRCIIPSLRCHTSVVLHCSLRHAHNGIKLVLLAFQNTLIRADCVESWKLCCVKHPTRQWHHWDYVEHVLCCHCQHDVSLNNFLTCFTLINAPLVGIIIIYLNALMFWVIANI